ncbi:hypothetical protein GCM10010381_05560 [Streptomyces xantholiticus]|nr:hypothetical protein GCM10010381_05560 [Streptomyces xantholiticus]
MARAVQYGNLRTPQCGTSHDRPIAWRRKRFTVASSSIMAATMVWPEGAEPGQGRGIAQAQPTRRERWPARRGPKLPRPGPSRQVRKSLAMDIAARSSSGPASAMHFAGSGSIAVRA